MIDPDCKVCLGIGWVCESHPNRAWSEEFGCQCGARIPSECAVPTTGDASISHQYSSASPERVEHWAVKRQWIGSIFMSSAQASFCS